MASPLPLTPLLLLLLLMILFITATTAPAAAAPCNATRIGDCLEENDEEFSMESEASRRILQVGNGRGQTKYAVRQARPFCNRNIYSSCIGPKSKVYTHRQCSYRTCSRDT